MRGPSAIRVAVVAGALTVLLAVVGTSGANAGQFVVASCQADRTNFSTTAFNDFATRGMTIRRACDPEGPGIRGLVTANVTSRGAVPRGSVAMVAINAPSGTMFTTFRWAGSARRRDCRYALQLYAEGPGMNPIPIKNVRANQRCPGRGSGLAVQAAGYRSRTFNVTGTTRIVQRVICAGGGGRKSCSARGTNYIRTYEAEVGVADNEPPAATIAGDTPLAAGAWVNGSQPLNYDAEDNVGIRVARALIGDQPNGTDQRSCALATSEAFATGTPCPNGPGAVTVDTQRLSEGTQQLVVQAQDTAGNLGTSPPVTVRIDNTAPPRVAVAVEGGDHWRNQNDFRLTWTNAAENDRAPIAAAEYKLCPSSGTCTQRETVGAGISSMPIQAPGPGQWTVSVWRRDAAGNADPVTGSDPVTLRYDPEPPQLAFDTPSSGDPTLVSAPVTDKVSGVADGAIEISAVGSNTWQTLDTHVDGGRLVARIDDASLRAGSYLLRATAHDQAHNESSTTTRTDGQQMTVTLPLRIASALQAGIATTRVVKRVIRRNGKRRTVRRRVTELRPRGVIALGRQAQIVGQLANRDGQGIAGADLQVFASSEGGTDQLVGDVHTDAAGAYTYTAAGSNSRTLRFVYAGSPLILPVQSTVDIVVPAESALRVSRRRVLNGQSVTFSGQVRSTPIPTDGKLIQLEVLLRTGWQTFRTVRTDQAGRWAVRYPFTRTRGVQWYRFRVELPREAGYPFGAGASKSLRVRVRGRT